jgi:hypothetical protein
VELAGIGAKLKLNICVYQPFANPTLHGTIFLKNSSSKEELVHGNKIGRVGII